MKYIYRKSVYLAIDKLANKSCGGNYCHNSIENDYCDDKFGFVVSQLGLVGSVGLG